MNWKLIILILITSNHSFSQSLPSSHGTLLVAVVCSDGIVIASDSRASWTDNNKILYAYVDSLKKIFPLGRFLVAVSGESHLENMSWKEIIEKYNKSNHEDSTIILTLKNFKNYLHNKLNMPDSVNNMFILAGYENNKPVIGGIDKTGKITISPVLTSSQVVNPYWRIPSPNPYNSLKTAEILDQIYKQCSEIDLSIGGPLYISKINEDNSVTDLKKFSFKYYKSEIQFIKSILNSKIKITYLYSESEKALHEVLTRRLKRLKSNKFKIASNF